MRVLLEKASTMGDNICFLPALAALAALPSVESISLVTTPLGRLIFRDISPKIHFYTVEYAQTLKTRALGGLTRLLPQLWGARHDVSLHPYHSSTFGYLAARLMRVPVRVGYQFRLAWGNRFCTERLPLDAAQNVVEINFALARHVAQHKDLPLRRIPVSVDDESSAQVQRMLRDAEIGDGAAFVLLHRGARHGYRQWPHFDALASEVSRHLSLPVVETAENPVPSSPRRLLAGLTFPQLAALARLASAFVGNNSGPMHLAGAMGTPTVIIQGPSAYNWEFFWKEVPHRTLKATHLSCVPCERLAYYPPRCMNTTYPQGCMKEIAVNAVLDALHDVLDRRRLVA